MTGRSLILSPNSEAVLRRAFAKGDLWGLNEEALRKCRSHGWIQGGDDEPLSLTQEGKKLWDKLPIK